MSNNIYFPGKVTTLKQCQPGDLVFISSSHGTFLAIKLVNPDVNLNDSLILVISSNGERSFTYKYQDSEYPICINFGSDWVIEPRLDLKNTQTPLLSDATRGLLHITNSGLRVACSYFGPDQQRAIINLDTFKMDPMHSAPAATFCKWKLWTSDKERLSPNSEPVFNFDIEEQH